MKCPFCGSPHATIHLPGRQAGERFGALLGAAVGAAYVMRGARVGMLIGVPAGPIGAVAGGFVGAVFAGMFMGSVGSRVGFLVGCLADDELSPQCRCNDCNSIFPFAQRADAGEPAAPGAGATSMAPEQQAPGKPESLAETQTAGAV